MTKLSIIVPTLNEVARLPHLLEALKNQSRPPDEVVIADAGSKDGTVEMARGYGALVVPGGKPGPGRNAGAHAASGDLLLFLDADVIPAPDFIEKLLAEFEQSGCVVATTLLETLNDEATASEKILVEAANVYIQALQYFSPHAPGFCILARRDIHQAINGFDEAVVLAEDFDYVQRAAKFGRFGVMTSVHIPVSLRRVDEDGFFQVAFKYVWCEVYALAGRPIYSVPFEYKFGEHLPPGAAAAARSIVDIAQLRKQMGRFENPLQSLSAASRERLDQLAHLEWLDERFRLQIEPPDAAILQRYLSKRLELISQHPLVRGSWSKLKALPRTLQRDSIRMLEIRLPWINRSNGGAPGEDEPKDR